jgi:hypothetical protein
MPPFILRPYGERAVAFSLSQARYFRYGVGSTNVDRWIEATLEGCGRARLFVGSAHSRPTCVWSLGEHPSDVRCHASIEWIQAPIFAARQVLPWFADDYPAC